MINAFRSIALVQSLVFAAIMGATNLRAADLRLGRLGGFNHGDNPDTRYRLHSLFPSELPLLRRRLATVAIGSIDRGAGRLEQSERWLFMQSGRARWQVFAESTAC